MGIGEEEAGFGHRAHSQHPRLPCGADPLVPDGNKGLPWRARFVAENGVIRDSVVPQWRAWRRR